MLDPYRAYLYERVAAWPELSGVRLLREVRERGNTGGITQLNDFLRSVRPPPAAPFEVRFETAPGHQAQVDFAHFTVEFDDEPGVQHRVWLFAMVLGHSRYLWAQYVMHQDLGTVLRLLAVSASLGRGNARAGHFRRRFNAAAPSGASSSP